MKEIKQESRVYEYDDGFRVEIVIGDENYEAWLWHKNYGIKASMFGMPKSQQSYEDFLETVEATIIEDIIAYAQDYMDGEDYDNAMDYIIGDEEDE